MIVGITNMPEFGILPTTEPRHTGPTRNPWDTDRTPGGSSGGAAAAVASGMLPVAHGNDGGGSLRIPAACCGLVGLKPSRGRVSRGPDLGDSFLACDGVLTRTVAETALLLDVLAGYEVGDATWAPRPAEPYTQSSRRDPGRLRIAMTADNALDADVDPECLRGMHETGGAARGARPRDRGGVARRCPARTRCGSSPASFGPAIALGVAYGELLAGRPPEDDEIEPLSRALSDLSRRMSSVEYLAALAQLQALARGVIAFFAEYDVLLTPALAERPLRDRRVRRARREPDGGLRALGRRSRPTRRSSTSRASRRSRCRPASARTGCRPTPSSSPSRSARTRCCSSPRSSRPPGRRTARPEPAAD